MNERRPRRVVENNTPIYDKLARLTDLEPEVDNSEDVILEPACRPTESQPQIDEHNHPQRRPAPMSLARAMSERAFWVEDQWGE